MAGICVAASIFRIPDDFTCLRCANDELTALLSRIGALLSLSASEFEVVDEQPEALFRAATAVCGWDRTDVLRLFGFRFPGRFLLSPGTNFRPVKILHERPFAPARIVPN